jgi:hypothetical protein
MPDFSPYSIALGGTDYPSKYAGLLGYLENLQTTGNKIINGAMEITQRGTSFAAVANGAYTLDRWRVDYVTSAVATITQQADAPADNEFQYSLRAAITTADTSIAAGDFFTIRQRIEGFNARDFIGRPFTLIFRVRSSKTGTHCVAFQNSGADRSYVAEFTVSAANTWESKSITVPAGLITAGTWDWTNGTGLQAIFTLAAGTTFHTTAGAWQTGNFLSIAAQVNCLDSNTNIFAVTGVDIKLGAVATDFEHRPIGVELALCQRYAYVPANVPAFSLAWSGGALLFQGGHLSHPMQMRASPTVSGVTSYTIQGVTSTAVGFALTGNANYLILSSTNQNAQTDGVLRQCSPNQIPTVAAEL